MNFTGAMKWKVSESIKPQPGQTKRTARFAWLPVRIGGALYWLEQYEQLYVWEVRDLLAVDQQAAFQVGRWTLVSAKATQWIPA